MPDEPAGYARAVAVADDLERSLAGRTMTYAEAGRPDGRRPEQPSLRDDDRPDPDPLGRPPAADLDRAGPADDREMRGLELGATVPATSWARRRDAFGEWAGIRPARASRIVDALAGELTAVATPIGDRWILTSDATSFQASRETQPSAVRLLPSGDTWFLLHGADRELLVPDARRRPELWTPRVWPGALLVDGEVRGTWRRANTVVEIDPWGPLTPAVRKRVEAEAASLPLPGTEGDIRVRWGG
jgi:hypothetical protein